MVFKTIEGVLHPDGRITLPTPELPRRSTRVMVTLLDDEEQSLADLGDYAKSLEEYEERLARGEIQWQ